MVPRLEKGFDASPNAKHRVPGGTAMQTFGQVPKVLSLHHVTSKSPPNCGYEREPWQNLMLEMLQNIGAIGTAAVPLAEPNSNPSLTKHRRPKRFAQSGKKGRLWAARQLLCEIAAGNFVCAFGSAEGLLGVLSPSSLPSRPRLRRLLTWVKDLLKLSGWRFCYSYTMCIVAWVYMACLLLLSIFEPALKTIGTPSSTTLLLWTILIHTARAELHFETWQQWAQHTKHSIACQPCQPWLWHKRNCWKQKHLRNEL